MNTSNVFVMLLVCILVKSKTSKLNEFHLADVDAQIDKALESNQYIILTKRQGE